MPLLFAHHDMLDGLDFLGLNPTTPGEHAFAFAVYALLLVGVAHVARFGWGGCRGPGLEEEPGHRPRRAAVVSRREDQASPAIVSSRRALGQLILCQGCCCGRTDRGLPEVPVERIKAAWKAGRLNRTIQLTISGCVGPCDVANVAVIVTPGGTAWFGGLDDRDQYDALVRWAESCHAAGEAIPTPAELARHRFDYLIPTAHACEGAHRVPVAVGVGRDRPESAGEDRDG